MSKLRLTDKSNAFRSMKSAMLERMANNAIYQFKVENFDEQGFVDKTVTKWAPLKSNSPKDQGRKINVKTGRLRRETKITERKENSITVGNDTPYADFINEGTKNMVARPFIGPSQKLYDKNQKVINDTLRKL